MYLQASIQFNYANNFDVLKDKPAGMKNVFMKRSRMKQHNNEQNVKNTGLFHRFMVLYFVCLY